ncbi:MAG: hypothetical protein HOC23_15900, partial [Halieaceae bacterium]|nr:hypothetical protein [Halieaceae bacterium]
IPNLSDDDVKPWDKQLADWMSIFRAALLEAPELHMFIALATKSPAIVAILEKIKSIATVLRREGLSEEASVHHAQGIVWTVMSFTYFESMAQDPLIIKGIQNTSGLQEYSDITPYFAVDNYDELWAETVKRNIDGIGVQLRHL